MSKIENKIKYLATITSATPNNQQRDKDLKEHRSWFGAIYAWASGQKYTRSEVYARVLAKIHNENSRREELTLRKVLELKDGEAIHPSYRNCFVEICRAILKNDIHFLAKEYQVSRSYISMTNSIDSAHFKLQQISANPVTQLSKENVAPSNEVSKLNNPTINIEIPNSSQSLVENYGFMDGKEGAQKGQESQNYQVNSTAEQIEQVTRIKAEAITLHTLRKKDDHYQKLILSAEVTIENLKIAIKNLETTIKNLETTINNLEMTINNLEITIKNLEMKISLGKDLKELNTTLKESNKKLNKLEIDRMTLQQKIGQIHFNPHNALYNKQCLE